MIRLGLLANADSSETYTHYFNEKIQTVQGFPTSLLPPASSPQQINVLDLCCGAGGLSFMAQASPQVAIHSRWAVDKFESAILTMRANHNNLHAFHLGIDEFLMLCKNFNILNQRYPADWVAHKNSSNEVGGPEHLWALPYNSHCPMQLYLYRTPRIVQCGDFRCHI